MPFRLVTAILAYFLVHMAAASDDVGFIYQGFQSSNLSLDGLAKITNNGLLQITNTIRLQTGHAFYPNPINFKSTSNSCYGTETRETRVCRKHKELSSNEGNQLMMNQ
ncbi:unnamed protein product [Coffea canephora]|uniref:DH200=94 genomic scaffold, scaffold_2822 n=1 Tax=Coffea canephora TaxID=49390 RepID=A0A068VNE3_COFCA|nr:unnamed protein product [Coffea canephora]